MRRLSEEEIREMKMDSRQTHTRTYKYMYTYMQTQGVFFNQSLLPVLQSLLGERAGATYRNRD